MHVSYKAGGADFLVKPFASGELNAKLNYFLGAMKSTELEGQVDQAKNTVF